MSLGDKSIEDLCCEMADLSGVHPGEVGILKLGEKAFILVPITYKKEAKMPKGSKKPVRKKGSKKRKKPVPKKGSKRKKK